MSGRFTTETGRRESNFIKKQYSISDMAKEKETKKEITKKDLTRGAVAVAASASVLVSGLFNSPADLVEKPNGPGIDRAFPPVAEEVIDEEAEDEGKNPDTGGSGGAEGSDGEKAEAGASPEKESVKEAAREGIYKIPVFIRTLIGVPLWALGWVISKAAAAAWAGVLNPVLSTVLGWVIVAVFVLLAVAGTVKAAFPDIPVKKILNKKTVISVIASVAVLGIFDSVAPNFIDGYLKVSNAVKFAGSALIAVCIALPFFRKRKNSHLSHISA